VFLTIITGFDAFLNLKYNKDLQEVWVLKTEKIDFSSLYCLLFQPAVLHSDINSIKSGLLHLTGQLYCKKGRSAKVKVGIINLILWNYLVDQFTFHSHFKLISQCIQFEKKSALNNNLYV
jgi:hypothetical protein